MALEHSGEEQPTGGEEVCKNAIKEEHEGRLVFIGT